MRAANLFYKVTQIYLNPSLPLHINLYISTLLHGQIHTTKSQHPLHLYTSTRPNPHHQIHTLYTSTRLQLHGLPAAQRTRKKELVENAAGIIQLFVKTGAGGHVSTGCQSAAEPRNSVRSSVRSCPAPPTHSTHDGDTAVNLTTSASGSLST